MRRPGPRGSQSPVRFGGNGNATAPAKGRGGDATAAARWGARSSDEKRKGMEGSTEGTKKTQHRTPLTSDPPSLPQVPCQALAAPATSSTSSSSTASSSTSSALVGASAAAEVGAAGGPPDEPLAGSPGGGDLLELHVSRPHNTTANGDDDVDNDTTRGKVGVEHSASPVVRFGPLVRGSCLKEKGG